MNDEQIPEEIAQRLRPLGQVPVPDANPALAAFLAEPVVPLTEKGDLSATAASNVTGPVAAAAGQAAGLPKWRRDMKERLSGVLASASRASLVAKVMLGTGALVVAGMGSAAAVSAVVGSDPASTPVVQTVDESDDPTDDATEPAADPTEDTTDDQADQQGQHADDQAEESSGHQGGGADDPADEADDQGDDQSRGQRRRLQRPRWLRWWLRRRPGRAGRPLSSGEDNRVRPRRTGRVDLHPPRCAVRRAQAVTVGRGGRGGTPSGTDVSWPARRSSHAWPARVRRTATTSASDTRW